MTDRIRPVSPVSERRKGERREADRREAAAGQNATAVVPIEERVDHAAPAKPAAPEAAFAAQLIGQGGRRRGLKGGPPVLDAARSAYLETEYSGSNDRRPRRGRTTRTEI